VAEMQYARAYTDVSERGWADDKPGGPIPFVASTPGVKRDGLDLRASGWKTDNYQRSPVVLWCHDHKLPPIGTAAAAVGRDGLRMPVTFDQEDPFAVQVESKVRRNIIRACSVGWDFVDADGQTLDLRGMTVDDLRDRAWYDLTELSIVPVGADPDALTERRRTALRSLSRELAALYDVQERPDSDVLGEQIRAGVRAELTRIGLDVSQPAGQLEELVSEPLVARVDEQALAAAVRAAFADLLHPARLVGESGPELVTFPDAQNGDGETPPAHPDSAARAAAIDPTAARDVLAAFNL
jgi:HK97 family phage prohead protease